MASFIVTNNPKTRLEENKVKQDAQAALTKCEKDEAEMDEKFKQWSKTNRKWFKRRKENQKIKQRRVLLEGIRQRGQIAG